MSFHYRCRYGDKGIHWFCSVDPEEKGHGAHYVCQPCYDLHLSSKKSASHKALATAASEPGSVLQSVRNQQSQIAAELAKGGRLL